MRRAVCCLALPALLAAACASAPRYGPWEPPLSVDSAHFLRLAEGACEANCAVYELTLYPDGSYLLMGSRLVESARRTSAPDEDSFGLAMDVLRAADFDGLPSDLTEENEESCPGPEAGLAVAEITIGNDWGTRTLRYDSGCAIAAADALVRDLRAALHVGALVGGGD